MTVIQPDQQLPISYRVVSAVAEREGIDPRDLTEPLGEVIDTDALDELFTDSERAPSGCVFRYAGYRIEIDGEGTVSLVQLSRRPVTRRN